MAETTETLFTVARGKELLTGLRPTARAAKFDLTSIETAMRTAGLEPDVHLATVTRTTTVSAPKQYVEEPVPEKVSDEKAPVGDGKAETKNADR
jgi:hypothetical protein